MQVGTADPHNFKLSWILAKPEKKAAAPKRSHPQQLAIADGVDYEEPPPQRLRLAAPSQSSRDIPLPTLRGHILGDYKLYMDEGQLPAVG